MENHAGMGCRELIDKLLSLLDDDDQGCERAELLEHLEHCPPCSGYLKSVRATRDALGRLADSPCQEGDARLLADCFKRLSDKIKGGGGT